MKPDIETRRRPRRILIAWGSKLGGTEGIAKIIGEVLEREGYQVDLVPAAKVRDVDSYDAALIGGAIYGNRWHRDARRCIARNFATLRRIPVWLFSSGPLDDSADRGDLPMPSQVAEASERIGARGHVTFGGRLSPDVKGFPAAAMAKTTSGDWRNPDRIRAWAGEVAHALPTAGPGTAVDHPARSLARMLGHGGLAWAPAAAVMAAMLHAGARGWAIALHAVLVPAIYAAVAVHYFRPRGARDPGWVALAWVALMLVLDAVVIASTGREVRDLTSVTATWLPAALAGLATWLTGFIMSTLPWPKPPEREHRATPALGHSR